MAHQPFDLARFFLQTSSGVVPQLHCLANPAGSCAPPLPQHLLAKTPTISRKQRRSLQAYYLRQNELIDALVQTEQIHRGLFTNDVHRVGRLGRGCEG